MSVTIHDYLVDNNNKLTALLGGKEVSSVFLKDTLIDVYLIDEEWWCDFFIDYTISCNDLAQLHAAFAGYWWCICPDYVKHAYKVSINIVNGI